MATGQLSPEECHECGAFDGGVVDSRPHQFGRRRRRLCPHCGSRWTTIETRWDEEGAANAHQAIMQAIVLMNEAWGQMERARDFLTGVRVADDADV